MRDPRPTTFARMREAAYERSRTIEGSEDARVIAGMRDKPLEELELLRDDFAGIVRLLDEISLDPDLAADLARRMRK